MNSSTSYPGKPLVELFEEFISTIERSAIVDAMVEETGRPREDVTRRVNNYFGEARVALDLVGPHLGTELRILEVGAGLCICSLFLKSAGYDIVALEPGLNGFNDFNRIKKILVANRPDCELEVLEFTAEELGKGGGRTFDLIFSNNVLEHIPDIEGAFDGMVSVLNASGTMVHSCPNYMVPFEPHFDVFVLKGLKGVSEKVYRKKISRNPELWESLNMITSLRVKRICAKRGLRAVFEREMMYRSFARLETDPEFATRHRRGRAHEVYSILKRLHLLPMIKRIPPDLSTPMTFKIVRV